MCYHAFKNDLALCLLNVRILAVIIRSVCWEADYVKEMLPLLLKIKSQ